MTVAADRRAYHREWAARNRDKTSAYGKAAWAKMTPEQKKQKSDRRKRAYLLKQYGITLEDWSRLHDDQGGVCALCRNPDRLSKYGKLYVDHCHETGRVRGLLCSVCNTSLGILGDTEERLRRVLAYVTNPQEVQA